MNRLKIVRGNDFSLTIPVRSIVFDKEGSKVIPTANAVPLDDCTLLKVNLVDELGAITPITSYSMPYDGTDGSLIVHISADLDCGWYGLEITYTLEGRRYRSYERKVFKIVENNGKSYVSGEQFEGEMSYQIDTMWTLYGYTSPTFVLDGEFFSRGEGEGNAIQQYGTGAQATGKDAIAIGKNTTASGTYSFAQGWGANATGSYTHAEGGDTEASYYGSHAEGHYTAARGQASHAEGGGDIPKGTKLTASGNYSHAEGFISVATGKASHAEGIATTATGEASHAEGDSNQSNNRCSHAEGYNTQANAQCAHAEGRTTTASGENSHVGGFHSDAAGITSFAHGTWLKTNNASEAAFGRYNVSHPTSQDDTEKPTAFSVGYGTADDARKNLFEIKSNGDIYILIGDTRYCLQTLLSTSSANDENLNGTAPSQTPAVGEDDEIDATEDNYYGGELIGHDDNYYVNPSHPTPSGGTANLLGTIEPAPFPVGKGGAFTPINGGSGGVSGNNSGGEMSTTN